ncbi:winged helix-turn-helix domain-containing protein [Desertihabitans aurantiacus]|uniref:winged helix-turn-helix domain-containing protein n=1 Tax=Desertihabitans aurantiacus TaxID=2282477 RepID=UPI002FCD727B
MRPVDLVAPGVAVALAGYLLAALLLQELRGPYLDRETHYLRVYIAQLRRKLEPDPASPRHLLTEPGVGYRLVP